jgi:hypothetical protein
LGGIGEEEEAKSNVFNGWKIFDVEREFNRQVSRGGLQRTRSHRKRRTVLAVRRAGDKKKKKNRSATIERPRDDECRE